MCSFSPNADISSYKRSGQYTAAILIYKSALSVLWHIPAQLWLLDLPLASIFWGKLVWETG